MAEVPYNIPDEHLVAVYNWIDEISFSRRRKDISRDFSDGVLCAELIGKFLPRLVDIHNYTPSCSSRQKTTNWDTLNRKVLSKLGIIISTPTVRKLVESRPGTIEQVLWDLKKRVEEAVLYNPNICPSTPTVSASSPITTTCLRPPSARIIGETQIRPVSALSASVRNLPKRQYATSSRLSVEFQQPQPRQQQQHQMSTSHIPIPIPANLSASSQSQNQNQNLHGQMVRPAPAFNQVPHGSQVSPVIVQQASTSSVQVQRPPPAKTTASTLSTLQVPRSGSGPRPAVEKELSMMMKKSKVFPIASVNSDDHFTTDDDDVDDQHFRYSMMNASVPAQILHNQRKVVECFQDKERQVQDLQSEVVNLNSQIRRLKTLVMVKDRRIIDISHQHSELTEHHNILKVAAAAAGVAIPQVTRK